MLFFKCAVELVAQVMHLFFCVLYERIPLGDEFICDGLMREPPQALVVLVIRVVRVKVLVKPQRVFVVVVAMRFPTQVLIDTGVFDVLQHQREFFKRLMPLPYAAIKACTVALACKSTEPDAVPAVSAVGLINHVAEFIDIDNEVFVNAFPPAIVEVQLPPVLVENALLVTATKSVPSVMYFHEASSVRSASQSTHDLLGV